MQSVFLVFFAVAAVVLDQISKFFTVSKIPLGGVVDLWPGVVHLTHIHNTGMAFSMLEGGRWIFLAATAVALTFIGMALKKRWITHPVGLWALAAIAGGAVGNLIDRLFLGYVVDMIELELFSFPVFNVADCFVVCGAILLVIYAFFFDTKEGESRDHRR